MTFEFVVWLIVGLLAVAVVVGFGFWGLRPEADKYERADWTGD